MSINTATVKTEDLEMRFLRFGSGKDIMVILPGMSIKSVLDSADFIASAYSVFADRFTLYLFDLRSDIPDRYTPSDMADDTAAALKELGLSDVYLFGVSLGGITSQCLAARYPELVHKLVLASTAVKLPEASQERLRKWIELAKDKKTEQLVMEFAEAVYSDELLSRNRSAFVQLAKMVTEDELERFAATAGGLVGFDTEGLTGDIKCPVFVIGGAKDKLTPADSMKKLAEGANAKLYLYEDGTHSVYDEKPDFKQRMLDFYTGD